VQPGALHGALDRFAQFFVAPLCLEGSLEREVLAVDSEFSGVLQSDGCRLTQLMCHTSSPGHLYRKFSWGNRRSLWDVPREAGVDVRAALLDYYRRQYSAERMALVVLGGQPLAQLREWVEQLFGAVPSGLGPRPDFSATPPPFEVRQRRCAGCWPLAAGRWLLAAGCWPLAADRWLLAPGCWLLAAGC
jgi:nardilysin